MGHFKDRIDEIKGDRMAREAELEARLFSVICAYDQLKAEHRALKFKVGDMALEHAAVLKRLTDAIISEAEIRHLRGRVGDLERENVLLRGLINPS